MEKTTDEKERFYDSYMISMKELYKTSQNCFERMSDFDGGKTMGTSFLLGMIQQITSEFQHMYSEFDVEDELWEQVKFDRESDDIDDEIKTEHFYLET
jgi:hypothetical protein